MFATTITAAAVPAHAGVTERASVSSQGRQSAGDAFDGGMSDNGRYVVFNSLADDLVPGDRNHATDVFLRDRALGLTTRVSVGRGGVEADDESEFADISSDGRFILFVSAAANLVANDTNNAADLFLRDRKTGSLRRVSLGQHGQGNAGSAAGGISDDGRYVVFTSLADDLVPGDTNGQADVFLRDLSAGVTRRVSIGQGGVQGNGESWAPQITRDGRLVSFVSAADNLVRGDRNSAGDIFIRDLAAQTNERVNVASDGAEADPFSLSFAQSMSEDGRFVAFQSYAGNLVPGDTNGQADVFLRDRRDGTTRRIVLPADLTAGSTGTVGAVLSASARFIAVTALLTPGGYILDRATGKVRLLSKPLAGQPEPFRATFALAISRDGRRAMFQSDAGNLVAHDTNDRLDVFVRNLIPW
jgi:Tol biopolymer transport system component